MEILYHYCPTVSFHKIVGSRELWLSSLSLSNDRMEGKLVARAMNRLADKDGLSAHDIGELQKSINSLEELVDGLGFCLSEKRDLLSQWRGYTDDGMGVSIGFARKYLVSRCDDLTAQDDTPTFDIRTVVYEHDQHDQLVKETYEKIKEFILAGAYRPPVGTLLSMGAPGYEEKFVAFKLLQKRLHNELPMLERFLFRLKAPAFSEEQEVRLFSSLFKFDFDECEHRVSHNRIIPFRRFPLEREKTPITEVVLGPKHLTPPDVVANYLKQNGFGYVNVTPSTAAIDDWHILPDVP